MPDLDLDLLLKAIIACGAVIGAWQSWRSKKAIQEVHVSLNSRLSQLLEQTELRAHAEGRDSMRATDAETIAAHQAGMDEGQEAERRRGEMRE